MTPPTFEYMFVNLDEAPGKPRLLAQLNQLGAEGWEVVYYKHEGGGHYFLLLKRQTGVREVVVGPRDLLPP